MNANRDLSKWRPSVLYRSALGMFLLIYIVACTPSPTAMPTPQVERVFRFPWFEPQGSIDPATSFGGYPVTINLFEGFVSREDPSQLLQAKSFESSEGGRVWTFELKEGLTWSDGTPLTAQDYEYAIKRYVDPTTASPLAFFAYYIKGAKDANEGKVGLDGISVQAIDDQHLKIEFERPY